MQRKVTVAMAMAKQRAYELYARLYSKEGKTCKKNRDRDGKHVQVIWDRDGN